MKNQRDRIIAYINQHGSITSFEALTRLSVGRLGARICELRQQGFPIAGKTEYGKNRYGKYHYTRYFLKED